MMRTIIATALPFFVLSAIPATTWAQAEPSAPTEEPAPSTPAAEPPPEGGVADAPGSTPAATEAAPSPAAEAVAPPPAPAAADDGAAAAAAALEAEIAADALAESVTNEPKLTLYGFADFTYTRFVKDFEYSPLGKYGSFSVGNLNLYLNADLGSNWRSLSEVRFTYLPHGAVPYGSTDLSARANTIVQDYTDLGRPEQVGGVIIERAWLEYSPHQLLTVRAGQWLTPYGIWNVDHGSPVIIGVRRPYIVGEGLFPERQTGLELHGAFYVDATQFGYHLTLSNGRGPIDAYQDLDQNKAIGGRLFVKNDSLLGSLTLGVSGYRGRFTDRTAQATIDEEGYFTTTLPITARYDELSLAADLKWEWADFLLQGEAILNEVAYDDRTRPPTQIAGPPGFVPDFRRHGVYALAAYRTPFMNLMPFFGGEYYFLGNHSVLPDVMAVWGGLNMRVIPTVVLKAQYTHSWFPRDFAPGFRKDNANILDFQAAWSF